MYNKIHAKIGKLLDLTERHTTAVHHFDEVLAESLAREATTLMFALYSDLRKVCAIAEENVVRLGHLELFTDDPYGEEKQQPIEIEFSLQERL